MNILHLKYAVEVAKSGSINKAAENLLMGQPNLSRAIKELEGSLGITIFDRSAKGMFVTEEGAEFLNHAKKILNQLDEMEEMFKEGGPSKQKFSISVPRACYISDAFAKFSTKIKPCPTELFYKETNSARAIKNILDNDYKMAIIRYSLNHDRYFRDMLEEKGLAYETVAQFKYVLIMSKSSPLSQKEEIHFPDLAPYIEIAHADPFVPSLPMATVKKAEIPNDADRKIFVYERASQFDLLSENNQTFMWVSPVPQKLLNCYSLILRDCPDNEKVYKDVLIYKKDYKLTPLDDLFITELTKAKRLYLPSV